MSYVRLRGKTGIYEYRRVIPPRLRSVIPSVEGFDSRPGRTEFTKSLETQAKAEANRRGAIIDQKVQAALDDAESRLATPSAWGRASKGTSEAEEVIAIDPRAAYAAIARWRRHEIDTAAWAAFNGKPCCSVGDEHLSVQDFRYNLQQFATYPVANEAVLPKLTGFDSVLVGVLAQHGIVLDGSHPAISSLRPAFAEAWNDLLLAKGKIASGLWEYVPDTPARQHRQCHRTAPSSQKLRLHNLQPFREAHRFSHFWTTGRSRQHSSLVSLPSTCPTCPRSPHSTPA